MLIDTRDAKGAAAEKRLHEDMLGWLTTVDSHGKPLTSLVWYFWDGLTLLLYSQAGKPKVKNIESNPRVCFHLNSHDDGGGVVVIEGHAAIDREALRADAMPAYVEKYREGIKHIGMTPETFGADYSVPIRIRPDRARYW